MRLLLIVALVAAGCSSKKGESERPIRAAAIAHGGAGSPPSRSDGCRKAVDAALAVLESGGTPLDAAIAGTIVMEDDPRFNAGIGSRVRLDGHTVQMDAAVMTSAGRFGGVAIIEGVKNPIEVARAVADTPHLLIAGDGATRFARTLGVPEFDPATPERKAQSEKILAKLRAREHNLGRDWRDFDWRARWNFETTLEALGLDDAELGHDTVGVAVRGADGSFAVALSTGGTTIMLNGRIGDTPILGAGLYAGPDGAVAATGRGERIIEATISRRVHDWIAGGQSVAAAVERGIDDIRGKGSIGLIAIGRDSMSASADRKMAWAARELGSAIWHGPDPTAPE